MKWEDSSMKGGKRGRGNGGKRGSAGVDGAEEAVCIVWEDN